MMTTQKTVNIIGGQEKIWREKKTTKALQT